jgi:hypothetical protein
MRLRSPDAQTGIIHGSWGRGSGDPGSGQRNCRDREHLEAARSGAGWGVSLYWPGLAVGRFALGVFGVSIVVPLQFNVTPMRVRLRIPANPISHQVE